MNGEELAAILSEVLAVVAIVAVGDERLHSPGIPSVQCHVQCCIAFAQE